MAIPIEPFELKALRATAMFRSLNPRVAEKVLAGSVVEVHMPGSRLFRQHEPAQALFLVLDGWVKIVREAPNGIPTVIGVFTRGQTLADAIAIAGGCYPVSAETVTRARLVRIDATAIRAIIHREPDIALAMIASTAQHLFGLMQQIEQLKALKSPERVAEFLVSLTDISEGPVSIALPFDKSLIAARLGMQPESLSRAFLRLRDIGVRVEGAEVTISDIAQVSAFAHSAEAAGTQH
ncbi:MAG TPA: cyclic nucleotide-binding domain-containing protein [Beijerinckiaceae bacterium]|nr:cyclic nucleotide-binding domain-containing protein [Beijerinckiaceae bacterium]